MITQNVPKLRFPEFKGDWQKDRLCNNFEEVNEKVGSSAAETYSITAGKGFVSQREKFGKDISGNQNRNYTLLKPGEFAYNKGNSKTYSYGCVYLNKEGMNIAVPSVFISFKPSNAEMAGDFFAYFFEDHRLDRGLRRIISSSARMDGLLNVNKKDFFNLKISYPGHKEQQKIADFLTSVDDKIYVLQKKKEAIERYKKGMMRAIFSQKIRFKNDSGYEYPAWQEKKLGELASITTGKKDVNEGNPQGQYRFYTCARDYTFSDHYSFSGEAIMIAGNAEVGLCHYYVGKFDAYQRTYVLQNFSENGEYLYKYLSHFFRRYALGLKQTSAMAFIKLGMLSEFNVPIPDKGEQRKIAKFLLAIDDKVNLAEKELEQSRQFKKALLQQMFV